MAAKSPTAEEANNGNFTGSVTEPSHNSTSLSRFDDLALEVISTVHAFPFGEACEKIKAILESVRLIALADGERRGIERGVALATKTQRLLMEQLFR